ncbi:hypothetical protein FOXYSP1_19993 [Fusarium oxysporum f. sp. phaseoli]
MTHSIARYKVASALLRFLELTCGAIVLSLLSQLCNDLLNNEQFVADGFTVSGFDIYTIVVAGISILYSIFFYLFFNNPSRSFVFDFTLFIMWLVAFCLQITVRSLSTRL